MVLRAVLESYGLRGDEATHAIRGLRSLLHGFVSLEAAGGFGLPLDLDESFTRLVRVFAAGLPRHDGESLARSLGAHGRTRDSGGPI